ncbi:unnamed protein product [Rotaria magnacalcarata]
MTSSLIRPSLPAGNNCRIALAGIDLWITPRIDNVFVYDTDLDIDRLKEALSRTLTAWPLVCGQFLVLDGENYVIEMSDNAIPFSLFNNTELARWPHDRTVVFNSVDGLLPPFLDEVKSEQLLKSSSYEPLFRLKVTRLIQSGEWVMGTSWAHVLGDAFACLNFLHTLSCFYQQVECPVLAPSFERRLWRCEEADQSLLPTMKHLCDAVSTEENLRKVMNEELTHDQLNIHFSGKQLVRLLALCDDTSLTIHDIMIAYIILTLNTSCFQKEEEIIRYTNNIVNYRGVSDSIAPPNLIGNCTLRMISENFDNPYSLSNIARSIRRSILRSRDPQFLEHWLATADDLMRNMARNGLEVNIDHFQNGIIVNSNFRYDWARSVDLGHTDKCRFHTEGTTSLFLRVFRLNPIYDGTQWKTRDREGAEVAFRIEKNMRKKFLDVWQRDIHENFVHVKK